MKKKFWGKTWFFEDIIPGEAPVFTWGFEIEKEIFAGRSEFQKIDIFENREFGRILLLDNLIQLSTKHENVYHEMLVQPAMFYHHRPEKVLIIGGGDGGVLREVVKHPVKEIFLVDIDEEIINVSKKYLPTVSTGAFADPRLKIFCEDALKFVKKYKNYFDVVIYDLTDPTGPSLELWQTGFFRNIKKSLRDGGIASFQTGYLIENFGQQARQRLKKVFPFFKIHQAFVGCFPFSEHTFSVGSREINLAKVGQETIKKRFGERCLKTKYYSPEIHSASRIMPAGSW